MKFKVSHEHIPPELLAVKMNESCVFAHDLSADTRAQYIHLVALRP